MNRILWEPKPQIATTHKLQLIASTMTSIRILCSHAKFNQGHSIQRVYVGYINKIHSLQQGRETLALQPCYKLGLDTNLKHTDYNKNSNHFTEVVIPLLSYVQPLHKPRFTNKLHGTFK